jgi:glucose/arabinose dehydrogenase
MAWGSKGNLDQGTTDPASGRSMIKIFNLSTIDSSLPADYPSNGKILGWGLRNSVGIAEHPVTGGIVHNP